jgi:hypothetical protein
MVFVPNAQEPFSEGGTMKRLVILLAVLTWQHHFLFYGCSGDDGDTAPRATRATQVSRVPQAPGPTGAAKITDKHGEAVALDRNLRRVPSESVRPRS